MPPPASRAAYGARFRLTFLASLCAAALLAQVPAAQATFSGRNGKIVYVRDMKRGLYTVDPETKRKSKLKKLFAASFPTWAPNGRQIAFASFASTLTGNLYLMKVKGKTKPRGKRIKELTPRTPNSASSTDAYPTWSKNGKQIAFVRVLPFGDPAAGSSVIAIIGRGGGQVQTRFTCLSSCAAPNWSPDGKQIAFIDSQAGNTDIYVVDASGGNVRQVTNDPAVESDPNWSPNGKRIAFAKDGDIFAIEASSGGVKHLTKGKSVDGKPVWSPDGRQIAFKRSKGTKGDIYAMRANGRGARRLTRGGASWPDWQRVKR